MQADVSYRDQGTSPDQQPAWVTHRIYEADAQAQPTPGELSESSQLLDVRPEQTAGQVVRDHTGDRLKDYFSPTDRGALGNH